MIKEKLKNLDELEGESIYIIREVFACAQNPTFLYSIGKDSSVLLHLARKAFYPNKIPIPFLHIDTGYKFKEMISFRDNIRENSYMNLIVEESFSLRERMNPLDFGRDACCKNLKTKGLLSAIKKHNFDFAIGGARRDEEKSRSKEKFFSLRNEDGFWDFKNQSPEFGRNYNTILPNNNTFRVFPLSNWTEINIWRYIQREKIETVPLYFAKKRKVLISGGLFLIEDDFFIPKKAEVREVYCRFRSLGCSPCTAAIESRASNISAIIEELVKSKKSERENRLIDFDSDSSMEDKKRDGYF